MNKKAFTLLELLVVVLIIGILTAIALPKYQLSVDKAEFIKFQSMATSLRDAYNEYILIHNKGTKKFEDLSISIPNNFTTTSPHPSYNCISDNDMFCCMSEDSDGTAAIIMCGKKDLSFAYSERFLNIQHVISKNDLCKAVPNNARANRLCSSVSNEIQDNNGTLFSPQGPISGYINYSLN